MLLPISRLSKRGSALPATDGSIDGARALARQVFYATGAQTTWGTLADVPFRPLPKIPSVTVA